MRRNFAERWLQRRDRNGGNLTVAMLAVLGATIIDLGSGDRVGGEYRQASELK